MRAGGVVIVLLMSGCFHRVSLKAPADDAPESWAALEPAGFRTSTLVFLQGPAVPQRIASVDLEAVVLRNDTPVEDPRDLIPLVLPESNTARLAAQWGTRSDQWRAIQLTAGASFVTGVTAFVAGMFVVPQLGVEGRWLVSPILLWSSLALIAVVPPLAALFGAITVGKIDGLRLEAFAAYASDLAARRLAVPAK